ncbi:exodeoxyribonuclease V alpha subunit [Thermomonospora echinospora]|uniref:Exodeoxyribonuclease V alpha subunit n=1 Tax=Thermomonospora echinospora TaxID=1992 RepID=A0A1H6C073_9ACTN|nr:helix-hairpin-helix domain-containing protein [Thermomonospora echinospora]SEG66340.1 exodeoxyribonuclease V alpha subunit [Thermomonospora echinospora]
MTSPISDPVPDPDLAGLLASAGVPQGYVRRAADRLGSRAVALLREDPWRLLRVPGVRPEQADHFARRVLEDRGEQPRPEDPRRGRALAVHVLTEAARRGHTAMTPQAVLSALGALRVPEPERAVEAALDEAEVVTLLEEPDFDESADFDELDELPEPEESLGLARYALAEEAAAEGLRRLTATAGPLLPDDTVRSLRAGLPEDRALALTAAARTGVSVLHGAPDEVEQTAAGIARVVAAQGVRVAVVTGTMAAARSLGLGTGLHELLEARCPQGAAAGVVAFGRGEQRPLEAGLVIVPDAGALDVETAAALVEACADGAHLVLGGDPAALPPTGPGMVLADLAASETVPVIDLAPPADPAPPARFTAAVRGGELTVVDAPGREVVIVPAGGEREAVHRAVQLVTDSIPRALGIPVEDVQVVTPLAGGEAGAAALNAALKARLNPGPGTCGGFDPGDRVIAAVPVVGVAAGEPGTVVAASSAGLEVAFGSGQEPAAVPAAAVSRLRHGWAATVALARGTRRPAVVAVLPGEAAVALSRPLAVTAFGLARRHLSVVHTDAPALARAVRENTGTPRDTRLGRLVRQ